MSGFTIGNPVVYNTYRTGDKIIDHFIEHIENECKEHGIELYLSKTDRVHYGSTMCTGYFDERLERLALAMEGFQHGGGPEIAPWLPTLAHEFAHMTQWIDDCDAWAKMFFHDAIDSETVIDLWLSHDIELNDEQLQRHLSAARGVEVDCEHRVLKLIDEFELPIDKSTYAKTGNAYAFFWTVMKTTRKWYKVRPYDIPEILELMPTVMYNNEFYDIVPPEIEKTISKICFALD